MNEDPDQFTIDQTTDTQVTDKGVKLSEPKIQDICVAVEDPQAPSQGPKAPGVETGEGGDMAMEKSLVLGEQGGSTSDGLSLRIKKFDDKTSEKRRKMR